MPQLEELPVGVVPCGYCGLPIGAAEAGSWSAARGELTQASHRGGPTGCLRALVRRVVELECALGVNDGSS